MGLHLKWIETKTTSNYCQLTNTQTFERLRIPIFKIQNSNWINWNGTRSCGESWLNEWNFVFKASKPLWIISYHIIEPTAFLLSIQRQRNLKFPTLGMGMVMGIIALDLCHHSIIKHSLISHLKSQKSHNFSYRLHSVLSFFPPSLLLKIDISSTFN